ncbi:hypothetical protein ILFOPFJJ_06031 [Ensifer psoraleae]|nr:hypothetical protein [Sinorhizobium psoraleae]
MSEVMALLAQTRLLSDSHDARRSAIEREFYTWRESLKRQMDAGVSKHAFEVLQTIVDAIAAATDVINTTEKLNHFNSDFVTRR